MKHGDFITLSENNKVWMIEDAQHIVQEMRERGCAAQRDKAGSEQEEAHKCERFLCNYLLVALCHRDYIQYTYKIIGNSCTEEKKRTTHTQHCFTANFFMQLWLFRNLNHIRSR